MATYIAQLYKPNSLRVRGNNGYGNASQCCDIRKLSMFFGFVLVHVCSYLFWLVRWCGCSHTTEPSTTMYFNWLF